MKRRALRKHVIAVAVTTAALAILILIGSEVLRSPNSASANPLTGIAAVAAGEDNVCFLLSDASVKCSGTSFGNVPIAAPGLSEPIAAIGTGGPQSCALTSAGGVKCWNVANTSAADVPGFTSGIAAISVSANYACALTTGGGVACWGHGNQAQLSGGILTSGVAAVAAGTDHACALLSGGSVKCWGSNDAGQLGDGSTVGSGNPVAVQGLSGASAVVAGLNHSCALTAAGGVKCWGHGYATTPISVPGLTSSVTDISASYLHTCARLSTGDLKCWGDNTFGELGDGLACGGQCPHPVSPIGLAAGVAQASAGTYITCATLNSGGAKCWGINFTGQLGAGTIVNSTHPLDVVSAVAKNPPTATPCSPPGCPTATPTPAGPPLTGIDWSIAIDVNGDGHADCTTKGTDFDTCVVAVGSSFTMHVNVDSLSQQLPAYAGFDAYMTFSGVTSKMNSNVTWSECSDPATIYAPGWLAFGCGIFAGMYTSNHIGEIGTTGFTCSSSGEITLHHGSGHSDLIDQLLVSYFEGAPSLETLSIDCVDPHSDDDGDGCTNGQELGASATAGGRRDPSNPWDYFDPDGNRIVRISDILIVVQHYHQDNPGANYSTSTDRTALGPAVWNLGPPDGQQRLDDILASVGQYHHDCS